MKNISRNELSKFNASETVANSDRYVALGEDNCVWGSGETEYAAEQSAIGELLEVVSEQVGHAVSAERAMRRVEIFAIVD